MYVTEWTITNTSLWLSGLSQILIYLDGWTERQTADWTDGNTDLWLSGLGPTLTNYAVDDANID